MNEPYKTLDGAISYYKEEGQHPLLVSYLEELTERRVRSLGQDYDWGPLLRHKIEDIKYEDPRHVPPNRDIWDRLYE